MHTKIGMLILALLGFSALRASAQFPVISIPKAEKTALKTLVVQEQTRTSAAATVTANEAALKSNKLSEVYTLKNLVLSQEWENYLKQASAVVRTYRRSQSIVSKGAAVVSTVTSALSKLAKSPYVTVTQLEGAKKTYTQLLQESITIMSDLRIILSPSFTGTDGDRLAFIDDIDKRLTEHLDLVVYFTERNFQGVRMIEQQKQDQASLHAFTNSTSRPSK